jgi:transglutaminase-like putative cysteine protease
MRTWSESFTPLRTIVLGAWLSTLFWPYAHSGGFLAPMVLTVFPLLLALSELIPRWPAAVAAMLVAFGVELLTEVPHALPNLLPAIGSIPHTLFAKSPAAWALLSPTAGLILILVAVVLGWLVFRLAQSRDRVLLLLLLGGIILVVNHTFWHLAGEGPLAAYLVLGLWLLADTHLSESAAQSFGRPGGYWYGVLGVALVAPLVLGWSTPGQPGHVKGSGTTPLVSDSGTGFGPNGVPLTNLAGYHTGLGIGDTQINHPVTPSDQTVLVVSGAPVASYWQTAIYTTFSGTKWSGSVGTPATFQSGQGAHPFWSPQINGFGTQGWDVTVAMAAQDGKTPLVYTGTPTDVTGTSGDVLPGIEELVSNNPITYHVQMTVPVVNLAALESAPFGPIPQSLAPDLQMPSNLSPRVKTLADKITQGATGPWQAAKDLVKYLDTHEKYTFHFVPSSTGNAVNQFLFVTHAGYCDQFSSSFIMMARSIGIPARWVVGYGPGTYNLKTHVYTIAAVDAHSWAQVYVAPYGWIPIDPTLGWVESPDSISGAVTIHVRPGKPAVHLPAPKAKAPKTTRVGQGRKPTAPIAVPWTDIAIVVLGAAAVWVVWRNTRRQWADPAHRVARLGRRLTWVFRIGRTANEAATVRQMLMAMPAQHRALLAPAVRVMEDWWYGGVLPDDVRLAAAEMGVGEVLSSLIRQPIDRLRAG